MEDVHWLVPTLAATSCWALSDVCCDYAIAGGDDDDAPPPPDASPQMKSQEKGDEQLTPEQNAVVSASVAAAAGLSLFAYQLKSKGATHACTSVRTGRSRQVNTSESPTWHTTSLPARTSQPSLPSMRGKS